MDRPTEEGTRLISEWLSAREAEDVARNDLYRRQRDLNEAQEALVAWMLPPVIEAKPGEKIAIWAGDSLIQVEVGGVISGDGEVRHKSSTAVMIRYRGKNFSELK